MHIYHNQVQFATSATSTQYQAPVVGFTKANSYIEYMHTGTRANKIVTEKLTKP